METNGLISPSKANESEMTKRALMELQSALHQLYGKRVPAMIIYGSQARREATSLSDIDILLIYPHRIRPGEEVARLSAILADLNLRYQVLVSLLPINEEDYLKQKTPLLNNIRREGVTIESI